MPVFRPTSDVCNGGDPAVAYSLRDHAFYLSQLCFFRTLPHSEVQIYKSLDNGATWTPGRQDRGRGHELRLRHRRGQRRHLQRQGIHRGRQHPDEPALRAALRHATRGSTSRPTDRATAARSSSRTRTTSRRSIRRSPSGSTRPWCPDDSGSDGVGESANQFSVPVVEKNGALDIAYVLEECNTSLDHGLRFQKSTDGGATFLPSRGHGEQAGAMGGQPGPVRPDPEHRVPRAEHGRAGLQPSRPARWRTSTRTTSTAWRTATST